MELVDQGPKLDRREFMSPEHQRAVLEGILIAVVTANLELVAATKDITITSYGSDAAEVFKDRFENLKRVLQDNMAMLEKCDAKRAEKAELFAPVLDEADELEREWLSRFRDLEIGG